MANLLTIEDITEATGNSPSSPEEEARWQHYIDAVSAFINGYVSVTFESVTDDTIRYRADYYGVIDLGGDPVSSVSSVKDWQTQTAVNYGWDGLCYLFDLEPNQVVDVTFTHGYASVPDDIRFMATEAVLGVLGLGATGPLKSFTVGDVTEVYTAGVQEEPTAVVSLSRSVLMRYTDVETSWRLGSGRYPGYTSQIPTL